MEKIKIALCQFIVTDNKIKNVDNAVKYINEASRNEANIVMLPEMFNCPYSNKKFYEYSESKEESYTLNRLSETVKKNNIYLIG
ncbi:MAG: nitrilase-related carbon-nitrogen hydrolase, partial [Clostridiales bacterium]